MPSLLHLKPTCNVYENYSQLTIGNGQLANFNSRALCFCQLLIVYCRLNYLSHQMWVNRSFAPCRLTAAA